MPADAWKERSHQSLRSFLVRCSCTWSIPSPLRGAPLTEQGEPEYCSAGFRFAVSATGGVHLRPLLRQGESLFVRLHEDFLYGGAILGQSPHRFAELPLQSKGSLNTAQQASDSLYPPQAALISDPCCDKRSLYLYGFTKISCTVELYLVNPLTASRSSPYRARGA